jgi:hypothetical protein
VAEIEALRPGLPRRPDVTDAQNIIAARSGPTAFRQLAARFGTVPPCRPPTKLPLRPADPWEALHFRSPIVINRSLLLW